MSTRYALLVRCSAQSYWRQQAVRQRQLSSSPSVSSTKTTRASALPKTLPSPRPMWSHEEILNKVATTNAKVRKATMVSDEEMADWNDTRTQLKEFQKQYREKTREYLQLTDALKTRPKEESEEDKAVRSDQEHRRKVIGREVSNLSSMIEKLLKTDESFRSLFPNMTHPEVLIGDESKAVMIGKGGDSSLLQKGMKTAFDEALLPIALEKVPSLQGNRKPDRTRDHVDVATSMGWMHPYTTRYINGPSWPVLSGPLATLEHALVRYAMEEANKARFLPVVVPDAVKRDFLDRTGFAPRDGGGAQVFWLKDEKKKKGVEQEAKTGGPNDLALAATAEIPLAGMCAGMKFDKDDKQAKQYVASSHAFRAEAGSRGMASKGLYRVHQFTKVELFIVCRPEESEAWLEKLRSLQESIIGRLGVPYRVLDMPTEELGASAYRKYDIEAWMPGRGSWGEVSSASNCTEYQARRLFIRYDTPGTPSRDCTPAGTSWAHTLNATALAVPRIILALLENYGVSKELKIRLPIVLKKHWIDSMEDQVEWIGEIPQSGAERVAKGGAKKGADARQGALDRVRQMASKSGTDVASMVVSFAILHELTAIVPLILLFYLLGLLGAGEQVMEWLLQVSDDESSSSAWLRTKIKEGMRRAESYGRKQGYFGFEAGTAEVVDGQGQSAKGAAALVGTFANAVAAYAITKALFPLRIGASIALTGPFARAFIEPLKRMAQKRAGKGRGKSLGK